MSKKNSEILNVGFIDLDEDDTDLGLSFAIYRDDEYLDSVILARSVYDRLLDDSEQGVRLSYDQVLMDEEQLILLEEATLNGDIIELTSGNHRFTLNLSKIEQSEIEDIKEQLKKLNYDNRFKLHIENSK